MPQPSSDPSVRIHRPEPSDPRQAAPEPELQKEHGGRKDGSEPTRFGDWEKQGRCIDF
jgi:hypothetical protein